MSLDGTYEGLKASVADFLNRSDLSTTVPDFIVLAESQMHRRFVGRQRQGLPIPRRLFLRSDASFAEDDEYIAVPTDFGGAITLILTGADATVIEVDYLDSTNLQAKRVADNWTGAPKWYTVVGSELQLYPVADQAYTGELTYIKRMPALTTANQATNWILQDCPDAYLYGALVQSAPYLKDDSRITVWGTLFTSALDDICNADPTPSDKSTLRSELSLLINPWRGGVYDVFTDA